MTVFNDFVIENDIVYFERLGIFDNLQLVGIWLLEEYKCPHEFEPLVEAMAPPLNEPSEHVLRFYNRMATGLMRDGKCDDWCFNLALLICRTYSVSIQDAIDKAQERQRERDQQDMDDTILSFAGDVESTIRRGAKRGT